MKKWYCIPHLNEVGSYNVEGNLTDFNRGTYLAYGNCCLVTGFDSEQEAREGIKKYPCKKHSSVETVGTANQK